jgi:hypothetical protein
MIYKFKKISLITAIFIGLFFLLGTSFAVDVSSNHLKKTFSKSISGYHIKTTSNSETGYWYSYDKRLKVTWSFKYYYKGTYYEYFSADVTKTWKKGSKNVIIKKSTYGSEYTSRPGFNLKIRKKYYYIPYDGCGMYDNDLYSTKLSPVQFFKKNLRSNMLKEFCNLKTHYALPPMDYTK